MRDLILFLIILPIIPLCVYRPWIGILAWSWIGYMNPHRLTWGFAYDFPFAQIIALATLAGLALYAVHNRGLRGFIGGVELKLLLLLWFIFTFTSVFALMPIDAWTAWNQISKIMIMSFLTAFFIDDAKKLRYLLLTIAFSIGFFGIKGGIFSILSGGEYRIWGPAGSFIDDNNSLALALNMILPFLYYLAQTEHRSWLRYLLYSTFALSILSVLFTYSRGGFIGLLVVLFGIFLTTSFRWKVVLVAIGIASLPVVITQLPDSWTNRMTSIQHYEQDASALSRLEAWKAAWRLGVDRPLIGGGFAALDSYDVFIRYNPEVLQLIQEKGHTGLHISGVHSIYFELLAENGFPGLFVFLLLCLLLFSSLKKLQIITVGQPCHEQIACGRMLRISLLAYLVTGTFLELASFDLFYQIVALTVVAKRVYLQPSGDAKTDKNSD